MSTEYHALELPRPPDEDDESVVVLYLHDPAFVTCVASWSQSWRTRVECWRATGKPYGVLIEGRLFDRQDHLLVAETDVDFAAAIEAALDELADWRTQPRWRVPAVLKQWVGERVRNRARERRAAQRAGGAQP